MYLTKTVTGTIEKNDGNTITVTFGHTNREDFDGDIFLKGAYDKSENVHHGRWDHRDGTPAGYGPIYESNGDVKQDITFYDTDFGNELKTIYETKGAPIKFSYKFKPEVYKIRTAADGRTGMEFEKIEVFRVDPVDLPATPDTGIKEIRAKMMKELEEAEEDIVEEVKEQECDIIDNSDMVNEDEELQLRFKFARLKGLEV